jgi:hypothetical protein
MPPDLPMLASLRLMRFLTALGRHIEIKIGAGQEDKAGDVTIKDVRRTAA